MRAVLERRKEADCKYGNVKRPRGSGGRDAAAAAVATATPSTRGMLDGFPIMSKMLVLSTDRVGGIRVGNGIDGHRGNGVESRIDLRSRGK